MDAGSDARPALDEDISAVLKGVATLFENYPKNLENFREKENQVRLLKNELTKARQANEDHWSSLDSSRRLIAEQQRIISQLVSAKEEIKLCKERLKNRDDRIDQLLKEREATLASFQEEKQKLSDEFEENVQMLILNHDYETKRLANEAAAVECTAECKVQEISDRMNKMSKESSDRVQAVIVDYEQQLNEAHKQLVRLMNEIQSDNDKNDTIAKLNKKIAELESNRTPKNTSNSVANVKSSTANLKQNASYKLASKCKTPSYPPLTFQTKETYESGENMHKKPIKRKLFNKDSAFYDNDSKQYI